MDRPLPHQTLKKKMPYELAYWQRDSAIFLRWGSTSQITPTCLRQVDKSSNCFPNAYFCASRFGLCTALIREASFYKREWLRKRPMGTSDCECSAPRATSTSTPSPKLRGYWGRRVGRIEELEDGKEHCEMLSCGSGMDIALTSAQQLWPARDV